MRKTLLAMVLLAAGGLAQASVELKNNHPDSYTVVQGDTLWDISGKFLRQPWKWPEIWHANPQVRNPHLIYPGDVLNLVYIDGKPRIMLNRGASRGTIKLSPGIRKTPMAELIPVIRLKDVNSFLINSRIIDSEAEVKDAPYVIASQNAGLIGAATDRIYVRGDIEEEKVYDIYREPKGKDFYFDPDGKRLLGVHLEYVGTGKVVERTDDEETDDRRGGAGVGALDLLRTVQEVTVGDRLFATEERKLYSSIELSSPGDDVSGQILDVPRGLVSIGKMDVVGINLGDVDGIKVGDTLAVYKTGETVRDHQTKKQVKLPDERAGEIVVYRVYDNISFALVVESERPISVLDKVKNP